MKGVDYSNTGYRRMYKPTAAFKLLGCEGQCVYWTLRPLLDIDGYLHLNGAKATEAIAVESGWGSERLEFIEKGLERLLEREWLFYLEDQDALYDPDFYEAEHASKSGKQRARDSRRKKSRQKTDVKTPPVQDSPKDAGDPEPPKLLRCAKSTVKRPIGFASPIKKAAERDASVTKRDAPVTDLEKRDAPVTFSTMTEHSPQALEVTQEPGGVRESVLCRSVTLSAQNPVTKFAERDATVTFSRIRDGRVTNLPSHYPLPNTHYPNHQAAAFLAGPVGARARPDPGGGLATVEASPPAVSWWGSAELMASSQDARGRPEVWGGQLVDVQDQPPDPLPDVERCAWELAALAAEDAPDAEPDVWQLVDADEAFHRKHAEPEPEAAASCGQEDEKPSFQSFATQVEDVFARATRTQRRLLSSAEQELAREWYDLGIDLQLLEETLTPKAATARAQVQSLIYFRAPVREAWDRRAAPPPPAASPPPDHDHGDAFTEFARQVEASFQRQIDSARPLSPAEFSLLREWFAQGIDVQLIDTTFAECVDAAQGRRIGSLNYFRNPVETAWRERQDLQASQLSAASPPKDGDLARQLDDLIARIPTTVPDHGLLVETIAKLRPRVDRDPQAVEEQLGLIEQRYLARIDLSATQERELQDMLNYFALRMPNADLTQHKEKLSIQLKRFGLGLPTLSLFAN